MPYVPKHLLVVSPKGATHAALQVYDSGSGLRAGTTWCGLTFDGALPAHVTPEDSTRWRVGRAEGGG